MAAVVVVGASGTGCGTLGHSDAEAADLSPTDAASRLARAPHSFVAGAGEYPATVAHAQGDADRLRGLGAEVYLHLYPDMTVHSFPADFDTRLPRWVDFILNGTPI